MLGPRVVRAFWTRAFWQMVPVEKAVVGVVVVVVAVVVAVAAAGND